MSNVIIVYGTVYGRAKSVAEHAKQMLMKLGHNVSLLTKPTTEEMMNLNPQALLVCTSTTGQGDIPGNIAHFYADLQANAPIMSRIKSGIITLGDSSYIHSYGGAGEKFEALLQRLQTDITQSRLVIDALEEIDPKDAATPWIIRWAETL